MRVGFIGLGKLGLPMATAMAARGIQVYGHDPLVSGYPADLSHEEGFAEIRDAASERMNFCATTRQVVENAGTIFLAVQTPHDPRFEGITPLPHDRADFDYTYLLQACKHVTEEADRQSRDVTLVVVSTVLPGTMARYVEPVLSSRVRLTYSPSFIAMGTTVRDFLDPEFVLLGGDTDHTVDSVYQAVYGLDGPRRVRVTIEDAELVKVAYNTFIGLKIAFANTLMEVCHKTGCDVDSVTGALKLAHRRLISPAYLDGGMGDGGGCHPRDNIALSWLARELDLSHDLFEDVMRCREDQAEWLACLLRYRGFLAQLPLVILGYAYKPESALTAGSPALLVKEILERLGEKVVAYDPIVGRATPSEAPKFGYPAAFLIGCRHRQFADFKFPEGSVVIDPFRYIPDQPGLEVIRLGERVHPPAHHGQARDGREVRARAA